MIKSTTAWLRKQAFRRRHRDLFHFLNWSQSMGASLEVLYDIGANTGMWATAFRDSLQGRQWIAGFEANDLHKEALEQACDFVYLGVLAKDEQRYNFYSRGGTGDSLFRESTLHYDDVVPKQVRGVTLNSIISHTSVRLPDLIKIDVQGAELDILGAGTLALESANFIYCEVPLVEYNVGAPSFSDYMDFFTARGFLASGVYELHVRDGALLQEDILFIKSSTFRLLFGTDSLARVSRHLPPRAR